MIGKPGAGYAPESGSPIQYRASGRDGHFYALPNHLAALKRMGCIEDHAKRVKMRGEPGKTYAVEGAPIVYRARISDGEFDAHEQHAAALTDMGCKQGASPTTS